MYITEYPEGMRDDDGSTCVRALDDVIPPEMYLVLVPYWVAMRNAHAWRYGFTGYPLGIGGPYEIFGGEISFAGDVVVPALNGLVRSAAERHGWTYVDGIDEAYAGEGYGHGYCAADSWIRNATDSVAIQGPWHNLIGGSPRTPRRPAEPCIPTVRVSRSTPSRSCAT